MLLLTNDDGFDAPGLDALAEAVGGLEPQVVRVAPVGAWSNGSHAVTTHRPIQVERRGEAGYAVDGSPADCVRVALAALQLRPSWVISGINRGANLGTDAWPSGTIAAAREAALRGVRAVAVSHYLVPDLPLDWAEAARWTRVVLDRLLPYELPPGALWNINLPHLEPGGPMPEIVFCPVDPSPLPLAYEVTEGGLVYSARYQSRQRRPGYDIDTCFGGRISVSLVPAAPPCLPRPEAGWP